MATKFSCDVSLPTTAEKLCTTVDWAYDMGTISCDMMKCILLSTV